MIDWRIKDYEIRCYNLRNRLTPNEVDMSEIVKEAKEIARQEKCGYLTALRILKKRLERRVEKLLGK